MSVVVLLVFPNYLLNGQGFLLGQIVCMSMERLSLYCIVLLLGVHCYLLNGQGLLLGQIVSVCYSLCMLCALIGSRVPTKL